MPTYYAEFSFSGKKVVRVEADSEEEALRIAKESMDSPHGPTSGLTVESFWRYYDAPRLVDDFSTRVRKQSEAVAKRCEALRERSAALKNAYLLDKTASPQQPQRSTEDQLTYYFRVPFTGQAVLQITARDEEQARAAARSSLLNLCPKRIEPPLISYSYEKAEPVMVKTDLD